MKRFLCILCLFISFGVSADEKIIRQIPNDFNLLSSVHFEDIFEKEMPFLREIIDDIDRDNILQKFEKAGFNLKLLKRLWFSNSVNANIQNRQGDWKWLTFIEFTEDLNVKEVLDLLKKEFKLEIIEGKIGDKKSFEINNEFQDIFIIQHNPRLIALGSKDSLKQSLRLGKMEKAESLQYSLLGNKQITDLQATVKEHQIWMTVYTKNPQKFINLTDLVLGMDFDKDLKVKSIMNFGDEMSCNQVYQFWPMLKGFLMQKPLFMENKHFFDTKFDQSILFKIIFTKNVLRRAGVMKPKDEKELQK